MLALNPMYKCSKKLFSQTVKLCSLLALLASTNIKAENCNSLQHLTWLLGEWQTQGEQPLVSEQWLKLSDKSFEGIGKTANSYESLRLVEMSEEVFYLAKVAHNPLPVAFKLSHCQNKQFTFENHQHDFPNKISYQQTGSNKMQVTVSGNTGKAFTILFTRLSQASMPNPPDK